VFVQIVAARSHHGIYLNSFFGISQALYGFYDFYKRSIGFEPTTNCLEGSHSTTELTPQWWGISPPAHFLHTKESIRHNEYYVKSPQRGFAPATIAYKAIILTAKTMRANG
jgi:hypothetical protein